MTERPILMNGAMVRATLSDAKTQTRRIVKLPVVADEMFSGGWRIEHKAVTMGIERFNRTSGEAVGGDPRICPHGQPGDRLWVRETWRGVVSINAPGSAPEYGVARYIPAQEHCRRVEYLSAHGRDAEPWRPSIHMPRWASRILLEVVSVRVERLNDCSEADAQAEGCFFTDYGRKCGHGGLGWKDVGDCEYPESHHQQRDGWMWDKTTSHEQCLGSAKSAFGNLWNSTGGDWAANPWCWVIEFKRVTP